MNKAYRLIWSQVKDAWVIVAEIVKGNGGPPSLTVKAILMAATLSLLAAEAKALPVGQQVVSGSASFNTSGKTLTITNSPNAIINWQGFSVAADERTTFNQQSSASAVLNRVVGAYRSDIFGMLDSNGRVFLLNPNGILFGAGSQINVAGLVASSLGISNNDFLNGNYRFNGGVGAGSVINEGTITTAAAGKVWLVAPQVENAASGVITAPNGDVVLVAGQSVNFIDPDNPEITVMVSAPADQTRNLGSIVATAGKVGIFGGLVSQEGSVSANSAVAGSDGRIFLKSTRGTTVTSGSNTTADAGSGGTVDISSSEGEILQSGFVSASDSVFIGADSMTLAAGSVNSPDVVINRATMGTIDFGTKTTSALGIDQSDLDSLSANRLTLLGGGGSKVNNILFSQPLSTSSINGIDLDVSDSIDMNASFASTGSVKLSGYSFNQSPAAALSAGGDVSLFADNIALQGTTDGSFVTITRKNWGGVDLGGVGDSTNLGLDQSELDSVSASVLRIGDTNNITNINVSSGITRNAVGNDTIHLLSAGTVAQSIGSGGIIVNNLAVETVGNVSLSDADNSIANFAATVSDTGYGGTLTVASGSGALSVGTVDGVSGITASTVLLQADEMSINQAVSAEGVSLQQVTDATPISLAATKVGGALELTQADLDNVNAGNLTIGNSLSGILTVSDAINLVNAGNLILTTGASLEQSAALTSPNSISLNADSMNLSGGITAPIVAINRMTAGDINLGSKAVSTNLGLIQSELDTIAASNILEMGGAGFGNIAVSAGMNSSDTPNLYANTPNLNLSGAELTIDAPVETTGTVTLFADSMFINSSVTTTDAMLTTLAWGRDLNIFNGAKSSVPTALEINTTDLSNLNISNSLEIGGNSRVLNINIGTPITLNGAVSPNILKLSSSQSIVQGVDLSAVSELSIKAPGYTQSLSSLLTAPTLSIVADTMNLSDTSSFSATDLTLATYYYGSTMDLGGTTGNLNIDQASLSALTVPNLHLGNYNTGSISVNTPIAVSGNLTLTSSGSVNQYGSTNSISAVSLELLGGGNFNLTNSGFGNNIDVVAGNVGSLALLNNKTLAIGTVNGSTGLSAANSVALTASGVADNTGGVVVAAAIDSVNGNVLISGTGAAVGGVGVQLDNLVSAVSGTVDITGDAGTVSSGVLISAAGGVNAADIKIAADSMDLVSAGGINGQSVTLATNGVNMVVTTSKSGDQLELTQGDLDVITAGNLTLESSTTNGTLVVGANIVMDSVKVPTISFVADNMDFSNTVTNIGGTIAVSPTTANYGINIDSAGIVINGSATPLQWTSLGASKLIIGSAPAGDITVNDTANIANNYLTTVNSDLSLISGNIVSLSTPLSVGANNLSLTTYVNSDSTQLSGASITAGGLELVGGRYDLSDSSNSIDTLAVSSQTTAFVNSKALTVGAVGSTTGINSGYMTIATTSGDLSINAPIYASSRLSITGSGMVAQASGSPIETNELQLLGVADYVLDDSANRIHWLAGDAGSVTLNSIRGIEIGTVYGPIVTSTGLSATGDINITAVGEPAQEGISVTAPLTAANITLAGTGGDSDFSEGWITGRTGVYVSDSVVSTGNITIVGNGGNGADQIDASGVDGGVGIVIDYTGTVLSTGTSSNMVSLTGFGGRGGSVSGSYYSSGGYLLTGGAGGAGIDVFGSIGSSNIYDNYGALVTSGMSGGVQLTGVGGDGGSVTAASGANG
ncbi:MAG: filamentous hemagglutinin N-terminal domain-containing protein [Desulfuromonadaceae bacterium]|nr:filamentous hemagglutinin N-terminal domain-containing protein [Desulfuromonadaceae bacterium]